MFLGTTISSEFENGIAMLLSVMKSSLLASRDNYSHNEMFPKSQDLPALGQVECCVLQPDALRW